MKRLGLIAHLDRPQVSEAAARIIAWGEKNGISIDVCEDLAALLGRKDLSRETGVIGAECDVVISLGGDGSMLSSARAVSDHAVPILGINLGSLGFLTEVDNDRILESLDMLLEGKYRIEERMVLEASFDSDRGNVHFAHNEVVIDHGESTNLVHLDLFANDEFVCSYNADGIIIATPTGSTAYSLSVGGPIINPLLEAIAVSPVSPHNLTLRPMIFPADNILSIQGGQSDRNLRVSVDGRTLGRLGLREKIKIKRAAHKLKLIRFGARSFYSVLRNKLHWGKRPLMNG